MEVKRVWAVYFSPTGTTQKMVSHIAGQLARPMGLEVLHFDFTLPGDRTEIRHFQSGDLVVFGVPVYAGRVPNVLLKYLNTLDGGDALAVPVVLFGNRNYDDALKELRNLLEDRGFHTIAAGAFVGEHSFSRTLGQGRPDQADLAVGTGFAQNISAKLVRNRCTFPVDLGDDSPLRDYYQPRDRQGTPIDIRKVKPKTRDTCTHCGYCAQICPMGSIDPEDVDHFTGICIKCGACIKKCPVEARYYDDVNYLYHKFELEEEYIRRAEPTLFL